MSDPPHAAPPPPEPNPPHNKARAHNSGTRRGRLRRLGLELLVIVAIVLALQAYLKRDMALGTAPEFSAERLDGQTVSLNDYAGAPMVLHFWATWCGICRLEQGMIETLARDHPVLTIAMASGSAAEVQAYLAEHGLRFAVINDPHRALAERYGVPAVPATFVINGDGDIRFRVRGLATGPGLRLRLWLTRFGL